MLLSYMCSNRSWFESLIEKKAVWLGSNIACKVQGEGVIQLKLHDDMEIFLKNVRDVPELKRNLISLDKLDWSGFNFKCGGRILKVHKDSLIIMKGIPMNGVYIL